MCLFQVILILIDIVGNVYTLSTHQPFITSMDYVPFIVLFNVVMIAIICLVDNRIYQWDRNHVSKEIGKGILDLYRHEH